jgi:hypothetical protein
MLSLQDGRPRASGLGHATSRRRPSALASHRDRGLSTHRTQPPRGGLLWLAYLGSLGRGRATATHPDTRRRSWSLKGRAGRNAGVAHLPGDASDALPVFALSGSRRGEASE